VTNSQNGWPVNPPRSSQTIPGSGVRITVANNDAGFVLLWVLGQVDARVEDVDWRSTRGELDDWGWADRPVRDDPSQVSNHASATAGDINATRHPLGVRNTFSAAQRAEIRRILAEAGHVVRWGGDYTGRVDEMHFEINAGSAAVAAVAARLRAKHPPVPEEDDVQNIFFVHGDNRDPLYPGSKWKWGDLVFLVEVSPEHSGGAVRRYMADTPLFRRLVKLYGAPVQWTQSEVDAVSIVPGGSVPAALLKPA
jgi:D-alanyl-D-alanine carboxypeptidase-like protein